jgi:hypothetical protein
MKQKKKSKTNINKIIIKALKAKKKDIVKVSPDKLKEIADWANQEVIIKCKMYEAGDLMDILFMADGGPFDNYFKSTLKLNNMTKAYSYWLNKMVDIVCEKELKHGKSSRIQQNKK